MFLNGIDAKWPMSQKVPHLVHPEQRLWLLRRFDIGLCLLTSNGKLQVLQEGSQRIAGVVIGTPVCLPEKGGVFAESRERLVRGEQCIGSITNESAKSC